MKKLILVVAGAILFAACSGKEQPQAEQQTKNNFPPCTIDGHDCWEVVQLAKETEKGEDLNVEPFAPQGESNVRHVTKKLPHYKNPKLEQIGLTVIHTDNPLPGKARYYRFSNGVTISKKGNISDPNQDWVSMMVSFPTFETFTFDKEGKVIGHTPAPDCLVNHLQCANLAFMLNRFFTDKPNLQKATDKAGKIKGERYVKRVCDGENCKTNFVKSDWQLVGISPDQRQQQGETYTYTLNDGRTVIFNWEPDSPEHGYLTVTETDGTQKKFDSHGKRVN